MNAFKTLIATAALTVVALATTAAQATVIDFNGLAPTGSDVYLGATATTVGGMTFKASNTGYFMSSTFNGQGDLSSDAFNGTSFYMTYQDVIVTSAAATAFSLNSLDVASWADGFGVTQVTLTGTLAGGGSISNTYNLNTGSNASKVVGNDFTALTLSGYNNLSSLTISHNGNYYLAIDNLVVNATTVPEPSSIALFGLALAAGAVVRRRRA